jgi:hypothetical protein
MTTGRIEQMRSEDVTRTTANDESTSSEAETDANIYDYGMYRSEKYATYESMIEKTINNYLVNLLQSTDNFVGTLNCHLVYTIEKNRRIRMQFTRLEGNIEVKDELRKELVQIPFEPVVEGGVAKISQAEYAMDKQVNAIKRSITIRYTEGGIILPKGGNDPELKKEITSFLTTKGLGFGEYSCEYHEININQEIRNIKVLSAALSKPKS